MLWDYSVGGNLMCQSAVKFSSNGNYFASVEEAGNLLVFDNSDTIPSLLYTFDVKSSASYSLDFSPDNQRVVLDGKDDSVKVFDIASGNLMLGIKTFHAGGVYSVAYKHDGLQIVSGGQDKRVKIWNASTGDTVRTLVGHAAKLVSVKFSKDDNFIFSADANGTIRQWSTIDYSLIRIFNVGESISQIAISQDAKYLVAAGNTKAWLVDVEQNQVLQSFNTIGGGKVYSVDFNPSATNVVLGNSNGDVSLYSIANLVSTIGELNPTNLLLYPNPAHQTLHLPSNVDDFFYTITTLDSKNVLSGLNPKGIIDVSILPSGIYFIELTMGNKTHQGKFLKN
jgi:WD40 repeat protein